MQGVLSHQKIEKRFWDNLPKDVDLASWVDRWCMYMVDWALMTNKSLSAAQVVEVHRAWQNLKKRVVQGAAVSTIRIVLD